MHGGLSLIMATQRPTASAVSSKVRSQVDLYFIHRLLTRLAIENLLHPFQTFILGQKNLAPRMAVLFDLPLVFYGENEAEYGNPIVDTEGARRDHKYYVMSDPSKVYLGGTSLHDSGRLKLFQTLR